MKKTFIILVMVLLAAMLIVSCEDNKNDLDKKKYKVGDTGPAGGIIFFVNPNAKADKWTYLEVGKSDMPDGNFKWGINWCRMWNRRKNWRRSKKY